jgi:hypothetical protein
MLAYISGIGGNARQVFYRSPNLTMLKVANRPTRRAIKQADAISVNAENRRGN